MDNALTTSKRPLVSCYAVTAMVTTALNLAYRDGGETLALHAINRLMNGLLPAYLNAAATVSIVMEGSS